jgi:hypothetical protein
MRKIKLLFTVALMVMVSSAFGQAEKNVSLIKAGSKLTDADIGFLSMVANEKVEAGMTARQATISGVVYKKDMVLTADQAKSINGAITAFQKTYKAPAKSRGANGLCYYWYYYCDGYGYCYWYKYYYYC